MLEDVCFKFIFRTKRLFENYNCKCFWSKLSQNFLIDWIIQKMPVKRSLYDCMEEDLYDICIPIYNDLAFDHGIHFRAKVYIFSNIEEIVWLFMMINLSRNVSVYRQPGDL